MEPLGYQAVCVVVCAQIDKKQGAKEWLGLKVDSETRGKMGR